MLQEKNPYLLLKSRYPNLHRVEKKIADFIFDHMSEFLTMTIAQIAKECEIAESSIVRFCKTLGYSGFREFKMNLATHFKEVEAQVFENINVDDSTSSMIEKVFSSNISSLQNTLNLLDENVIESAIDSIIRANKILFVAMGSSAPIANEFYYRFMRMGLPAQVATDPYVGLIASSQLDENSVAIAISHKGRTAEIVENLKISKEKKATTISVTNFENSPMTKYSDIVLCAAASESEILNEAIASRISQLTILDCVYTGIALARKDTALAHIQSMHDLLDQHRIK